MQSVNRLFINYLKCSLNRNSTKESKSRAVKLFTRAVGGLSIDSVRYCHAEDFRGFLSGRAAKTINLYLTHIKVFLEWCVRRGYLQINPWTEITNLPVEDKLTEPFTEEEILRMVEVAWPEWKIMILLGYCSGLRVGELLNLTKDDLILGESLLKVQSKKKTATTWAWSIKNRKIAYSPLPDYCGLHQMLRDRISATNWPYLTVSEKRYQQALRLDVVRNRDLIGNFDRRFKKICQLANVRRGSFQGLRVSFVNRFRKAGYDPKAIQVLARHRNIATTMRYYCYEDNKDLAVKAANFIAGR